MIPKAFLPLLPCLVLASCGQDWQIARGPIDRPGSTWGQSAGDEPELAPEGPAAPTAPRPSGPSKPAPISGNPFDVPDVTRSLPGERDLKAGGTPAAPAPVEPQDPDGPTIRATPGGDE